MRVRAAGEKPSSAVARAIAISAFSMMLTSGEVCQMPKRSTRLQRMIGMRLGLALQCLGRQVPPIGRLDPDQQPAAIGCLDHPAGEMLYLMPPFRALARSKAGWRCFAQIIRSAFGSPARSRPCRVGL